MAGPVDAAFFARLTQADARFRAGLRELSGPVPALETVPALEPAPGPVLALEGDL